MWMEKQLGEVEWMRLKHTSFDKGLNLGKFARTKLYWVTRVASLGRKCAVTTDINPQ